MTFAVCKNWDRGASAGLVEGKESQYKMFWVGNDKGMGGVGILLAEK